MAVDTCEPEVIAALEKQGWRVKDKPLMLPLGMRSVYADLLLSQTNEDFEQTLLVVEVKCFNHPEHDLSQLYDAVGQYVVYQYAMREEHVDTAICLAIPVDAYERLINVYELDGFFEHSQINLVIIDINMAEVLQWITWTPS